MDRFLEGLQQARLNLDFGQGRTDLLIDAGFAGTGINGEDLCDASCTIPAGFVDSTLLPDQVFDTNVLASGSMGSVFPFDGSSALVSALVSARKA